jgi:hypothetical protein
MPLNLPARFTKREHDALLVHHLTPFSHDVSTITHRHR